MEHIIAYHSIVKTLSCCRQTVDSYERQESEGELRARPRVETSYVLSGCYLHSSARILWNESDCLRSYPGYAIVRMRLEDDEYDDGDEGYGWRWRTR